MLCPETAELKTMLSAFPSEHVKLIKSLTLRQVKKLIMPLSLRTIRLFSERLTGLRKSGSRASALAQMPQ